MGTMTAVAKIGRIRRWTRVGIFAAIAVLASLAMLARPVAADPVGVCPDNLMPVPASLVVQGAQKDHNRNGWVCAKYHDGQFVGGPDDMVDDIVL
jgi:hypothetical protein